MDEFRELYHWYVPEYDYKLPPGEMDKWNVIVNVGVWLAIIVGLLLFGLFCKLKHRWLVNAKCAFCNCAMRVWRAKLHWWFCNHCQRINGYPKKDSSVHADSSSSGEEVRELNKDDSFKLKLLNTRNNRIKSPSQCKRIVYSKNDLSASTIISRSPKVFDEDDDLLQDENNAQMETSFQKIRNKIKEMLVIGRGIEKLSGDAVGDCSGNFNANSTRLPVEISNLRKMHMKLIVDDVNRRYELLSAERTLCEKMKQMKALEKTLRRDRRDFANDTLNKTSHSIRKRNTFFERPLNHSITPTNVLNVKEINLKKDVSTRLATLEAHLTELRDMHVNEIASLKSQIENKVSVLKKLEHLKFGMGEYRQQIQGECDILDYHQTPSRFDNLMLQLEKTDQVSDVNDSESNKSSMNESVKNPLDQTFQVKNEMSVIVEESLDNHEKTRSSNRIKAMKRTFEHFEQDNKETLDEENKSSAPAASVAERRRRARIVKPIRSGQRPAAAKVVLSCGSNTQQ